MSIIRTSELTTSTRWRDTRSSTMPANGPITLNGNTTIASDEASAPADVARSGENST